MHLDIAAHEWLRLSETDFYHLQVGVGHCGLAFIHSFIHSLQSSVSLMRYTHWASNLWTNGDCTNIQVQIQQFHD